jgi:hypothetical protein
MLDHPPLEETLRWSAPLEHDDDTHSSEKFPEKEKFNSVSEFEQRG